MSTTTTTKAPEPIFYDRIVTSSEKVSLINDFMNCNFANHTKTFTSPTARFFVFQLPNPGKNFSIQILYLLHNDVIYLGVLVFNWILGKKGMFCFWIISQCFRYVQVFFRSCLSQLLYSINQINFFKVLNYWNKVQILFIRQFLKPSSFGMQNANVLYTPTLWPSGIVFECFPHLI